jgi:hypothetical protein
LTATRNFLNSDDDDDDDNDLPDIDKLLSRIKQKDISASADPNRDDDNDFLNIDEFLSGIQQKIFSASVKLDSGGMAEKVDNGTRSDSPVDSSRSTMGSTQGKHTTFLNLAGLLTHTIPDPIILSDDESVGTESDTDYSK